MPSEEAEEPGASADAGTARAISALELSEERFRLLVESVVDYAIFMLSPDGTIVSWNAGAQRIKGYAEQDIVGRHFSVFYTEEDREAGLPDRLLETARREGRVEDSGWRVRADDTRFWASVVITALRDDDGALIGFAKVTRDMTDAHRAEAAREEALREQRRLVERLEELDEWRRGFISSVTHDMQTPVSAIAGFADIMLAEEMGEDERRDLTQRIRSNAQTLEDLLDHLRTFAYLESGQVELDPEPLELSSEVEDIVAGMRPVIGDHRVDIDVDGVQVVADRQGLQRILQNLLDNASRHSPPGTPIHVRAEVDDDEVAIEVEDEGEGIAEGDLARVFERYRRGRRGGTGLGLSIVERYVELHGGQVSVDSVEGEGATFRFTLPTR